MMRVVVAGQMPPPYGGQNLNIKKLYEMLSDEDELIVEHWEFSFTKDVSSFRKLSIGKIVALFGVIFRLFTLRRRGRIDLIIYPSGGPHTVPIIRDIMILPFATLLSQKVWVHFHAGAIAERLPLLPAMLRVPLKAVHKRCYGGIVLTDFGRADSEDLGLNKTEVIPIGVVDRRQKAQRKKTSDALTLLYVGHLREDKGTDVLIKAFGKINAQYTNTELHLVGECSSATLDRMLHPMIDNTGCSNSIKVMGLLQGDALKREFEEADLFVFPSEAPSESYGMVLVEAMMHALPVVAADWRAAREVLKDDTGEYCYQIGDNHQMALEEILARVINQSSKWSEWGCLNRDKYEEYYSMDVYHEKMINLIFRKSK